MLEEKIVLLKFGHPDLGFLDIAAISADWGHLWFYTVAF
jgi:hypothetical protein